MKKINGKDVSKFRGFAYDGCHKIYLFKTRKEQNALKDLGYSLYALNNGLIQCYLDSCSLRFIQTYGGNDNSKYVSIVRQGCDEVVFEGFDDLDNLDLNCTNCDLSAKIEDGKVLVKPLDCDDDLETEFPSF